MDQKKIALFLLSLCAACMLYAQEQAYSLQEVVVRPGVNPAHRIVENAIRNRDKNNPEKGYRL